LACCLRVTTISLHNMNVWYISNIAAFAYKVFGKRQTLHDLQTFKFHCMIVNTSHQFEMIEMKHALIVYDTTFGNTKLLAEEIAAGIQDAGEITCVIKHHKKLNGCDIRRFDAFLFGSPIHAAMATRGIKSVIKKAAKAGLDGKIMSTFDTHMGHEGRGVRNMEKLLTKVAPDSRLISPGFSAAVDGFRGPLSGVEIPKAREFGNTLGKEILG